MKFKLVEEFKGCPSVIVDEINKYIKNTDLNYEANLALAKLIDLEDSSENTINPTQMIGGLLCMPKCIHILNLEPGKTEKYAVVDVEFNISAIADDEFGAFKKLNRNDKNKLLSFIHEKIKENCKEYNDFCQLLSKYNLSIMSHCYYEGYGKFDYIDESATIVQSSSCSLCGDELKEKVKELTQQSIIDQLNNIAAEYFNDKNFSSK